MIVEHVQVSNWGHVSTCKIFLPPSVSTSSFHLSTKLCMLEVGVVLKFSNCLSSSWPLRRVAFSYCHTNWPRISQLKFFGHFFSTVWVARCKPGPNERADYCNEELVICAAFGGSCYDLIGIVRTEHCSRPHRGLEHINIMHYCE